MHHLFNCDEIPEVICSNLQASSWSFSHFFLWRAFRVLFDCGEGTGIRLDEHVFRVDVVALSHGHSDHCRGLVGFLEVRGGLKGATEKPLTVVCPAGSATVGEWVSKAQAFCLGRGMRNVTFHPLNEGTSFPMRNGRVLQARAVPHEDGEQCFAYRIGRTRKRLKDTFRNLSAQEIAELARRTPRDQLEEDCFECEIAYSGDTEQLQPDFCQDTQVLIHEATFLYSADAQAEKGCHSTVDQAIRCAVEAKAKHLVLFHISRRYTDQQIVAGVGGAIQQAGLQCPVVLIRGSCNLPTD